VAKLTTSETRSRVLRRVDGVEANARLTGSSAAVLLLLLAAEGLTIPLIQRLLTAHVVIGMVLVPPVLVKLGSTGYRFVRYYTGKPAYVKRALHRRCSGWSAPSWSCSPWLCSGAGSRCCSQPSNGARDLMFLHKATFVLWFGAMTIHVLSHLSDTAKLAPRDWYGRTRREIAGTRSRQWLLVVSVALGILLGMLLAARGASFLSTVSCLADVGQREAPASACSDLPSAGDHRERRLQVESVDLHAWRPIDDQRRPALGCNGR